MKVLLGISALDVAPKTWSWIWSSICMQWWMDEPFCEETGTSWFFFFLQTDFDITTYGFGFASLWELTLHHYCIFFSNSGEQMQKTCCECMKIMHKFPPFPLHFPNIFSIQSLLQPRFFALGSSQLWMPGLAFGPSSVHEWVSKHDSK